MLRSRGARGAVGIAYLAIGCLAAIMYVGVPHVPLAGSLLGLAVAFALAIGPVALPFAIARPLILPLALWAALVPFDNMFKSGGMGSVEKLLGAGAALAAFLCVLVRRRGFAPPLSVGIWGAYSLLCIASLWWAQSAVTGTMFLQQSVGLLLVGVVISMVPADATDLRALFCGIVGGGVGASIYSLAQYMKLGHSPFMELTGAEQVIDHNHFGAALLLPLICSVMAAICCSNRWVRILCAVTAAICLAGIGSSESRSSMISFGVAVIYILLRSRHRWRLLPWAAAIPVLLAAVPGVAGRFNDPDASTGAGRYEIWQIGFAAFKHNWLAGSGYGTFRQAYQAAFLEFSQQSSTAQRSNDPHSLIVQNAVELGIIGLALALFAWWSQFRTLRGIALSGGWGDVRVTIEAVTLALFVMALTVELIMYKYAWLSFYVAWIARSAYLNSGPRHSASDTSVDSDRFGRNAPLVVAQ